MKLATIKPATLAQAKKMTDELREYYESLKGGWYDLGKKYDAAIQAQVPHALGLNLPDWVSQWAGDEEGRSTVYDSLKIIRALAKLPEATVRALPKGNALELTKLPESKRLDANWIHSAKVRPTREFKEMVRAEREGKRPAMAKDDGQEFRCLKVESLPKETYDQIIEFRDRICKVFNCGEKPLAPWILVGAFLAMVEQDELEAFYEGVSKKVKAS